jgi:hypothetical protein
MDPSTSISIERDSSGTISGKKSKRDSEYDEGDEKSSRKKSKKSSKEHKSHKEKREKKTRIEDDSFELKKPLNEMSSVIESTESSNINPVKVDVVQVSKVDFFANLASSESQKPAVGTVHTIGKKVDKTKKDSNWTCPKCSTSNQNNSHQCHKCKAIKRMTEYR